MPDDLRDTIFASLAGRTYIAEVHLIAPGIVCGVELAAAKAESSGCRVLSSLKDGDVAVGGVPVLRLAGTAKAIAIAEDCVPGAIGKSSAIARAVRQAQSLAGLRVRVVTGAAKKMPEEIKGQVRRAIHRGGGSGRIVDGPFVYLDKNYVRMFGSVHSTLAAVAEMKGYVRVIQLRGQIEAMAREAESALEAHAEILMVDTGVLDDLDTVAAVVREKGRRAETKIAFAGDIAMDDIQRIVTHDVDILDVGRAVLDAPIIDVKVDVVSEESRHGC